MSAAAAAAADDDDRAERAEPVRVLNPPPVHHADGVPCAAHVSLSALGAGHVGRKLRLVGQCVTPFVPR